MFLILKVIASVGPEAGFVPAIGRRLHRRSMAGCSTVSGSVDCFGVVLRLSGWSGLVQLLLLKTQDATLTFPDAAIAAFKSTGRSCNAPKRCYSSF